MKKLILIFITVFIFAIIICGSASANQVNVTNITISAKNSEGYIFVANESGEYIFTGTGGAYNRFPTWEAGWAFETNFYVNRKTAWIREPGETDGTEPEQEDFRFGWDPGPPQTYSVAESRFIGSFVKIPLNAGDFVQILIPTYLENYPTNLGELKFSISMIKKCISFTYSPKKPMVGGRIDFDASSSIGNISKYEWDFDSDGKTDATGVKAYYKYTIPQKCVVKLTVTDNNGYVDSCSKLIDLSLKAGDILVERPKDPVVPGDSWTHAAIVARDANHLIEVLNPGGVTYSSIDKYFYPDSTWIAVYRVTDDLEVIDKVMDFVEWELEKNKNGDYPYDLLALYRQAGGKFLGFPLGFPRLDSNTWYCSELIWAAYMNASNKSINLDTADWGNAVHPMELVKNLTLVGEHKEVYPPSGALQDALAIIGRCPIDITITSPDGLILSKTQNQIPNSYYEEGDFDGDGDIEDFIYIQGYNDGNYTIQVIPETPTSTGTYSLDTSAFTSNGIVNIKNIVSDAPVTQNTQTYNVLIDYNAPIILATSPTNGSTSIPNNKTISVKFNEAIKKGSTFFVELKNSTGTAVKYSSSISGNILYIDPNNNLAESLYTLIIHTGAVNDLAGNPVALKSFKFSVGTSPKVLSINPVSGATKVARNKTITVTFNESVKSGTNYSKITLKSSTGKTVTISKSISGKVLTIKHSSLLAAKTKYTLTLYSGCVKDLAGNPLAAKTITFTTGSS